MGTGTSRGGGGQPAGPVEERVKELEKRLDALLSGKVELEVQDIQVAPRSKLRVACE